MLNLKSQIQRLIWGGSDAPTDATPIASATTVKTLQDRVDALPTLNEGQMILQRLSRLETVNPNVNYFWTPSSGQMSPWVVMKPIGSISADLGLVKLFKASTLSGPSVIGVLCKLKLEGTNIAAYNFNGRKFLASQDITIYDLNSSEVSLNKDSMRVNLGYTLFSPLIQ